MNTDRSNHTNIDAYIAQFPEEIRATLERIRASIRKAAPDAEEKISYQIPTFSLNGNLVHFAAYKDHIGFYPGAAAIEKFGPELSRYEIAKGTVRFPVNAPIPLDLIERIVKYRVDQNLKAAAAKRK